MIMVFASELPIGKDLKVGLPSGVEARTGRSGSNQKKSPSIFEKLGVCVISSEFIWVICGFIDIVSDKRTCSLKGGFTYSAFTYFTSGFSIRKDLKKIYCKNF